MNCLKCNKDIGNNIGLCDECKAQRTQGKPTFNGQQQDTDQKSQHTQEYEEEREPFSILKLHGPFLRWAQSLSILVCIYLIFRASGCAFNYDLQYSRAPGITVPTVPEQINMEGALKPWAHNGSLVVPLAKFKIRSRVLMAVTHSLRVFDGAADISPYDYVLGWESMSDTRNLKGFSLTHSTRRVWWSCDHPHLSCKEISLNLSNLHAIPANDQVWSKLSKISVDDIVTLSGYLVEVQKAGYQPWRSSLTREDSGDGACEIMWIEEVEN